MSNITTTKTSLTSYPDNFRVDFFARWTDYLDSTPKTVQTYTRAIKQFANYLRDNDITSPTREDVMNYRNQLRDSHKPTTVQAYMAAIKGFFQWTASEGLYPDISKNIKGARLDKGYKKDYLTSTQAAGLLKSVDTTTVKGKRDYAILALMLTAGLRTIEVVRANVEDLQTRTGFTVLYIQGKGHEERTDFIKVSLPVERAIRDYLSYRPTSPKSPLFASIANRNQGGRMTTISISRIVKEHLTEAGLKTDRITAHSLRHTAATINRLNGGTLEETKQLLRHSDINTTLIYDHMLERDKNNSEDRISAIIF